MKTEAALIAPQPADDAQPAQGVGAKSVRWFLIAAGVLAVVSVLAYIPNITRIGLYLDDWRNFGDLSVDGRIDWLSARPVNLAVLALGWKLFGLNVEAYLITQVILHFVSALSFWLFLHVALPSPYKVLALPVAALFLVYPSNYSRLWITLWPHSLLVTLILAGTLAYVLFVKGRSAAWLVLSLVLWGISLFWYELQLALLLALPLLGINKLLRASWGRRFLLISPSILGAAFILFFWQSSLTGYKTSGLVFTVPELIRRMIGAYWAVLVVAWIEPLRFLGREPLGRLPAVLLFLAIMAVAIVVAVLLTLTMRDRSDAQPNQVTLLRTTYLSWLVIIGLSLIVIGLGVLPGLPRGVVRSALFDGRFTLFSSLGAAVFVVLMVYALGVLLVKRPRAIICFTSILVVVLIVLSVVYQWGSQRALAAGWERQQCAWQSMLAQAPSFRDGTHIHIIDVPAESGIWGVSPFGLLVAEVDSAVRLIYGNPSLTGSFSHESSMPVVEGINFRLTADGILNQDTGEIVAYQQAVVFRYRPDDSLELLKTIPPELSGASTPQPTGVDRILQTPVESAYRTLIGSAPHCAYSSAPPLTVPVHATEHL